MANMDDKTNKDTFSEEIQEAARLGALIKIRQDGLLAIGDVAEIWTTMSQTLERMGLGAANPLVLPCTSYGEDGRTRADLVFKPVENGTLVELEKDGDTTFMPVGQYTLGMGYKASESHNIVPGFVDEKEFEDSIFSYVEAHNSNYCDYKTDGTIFLNLRDENSSPVGIHVHGKRTGDLDRFLADTEKMYRKKKNDLFRADPKMGSYARISIVKQSEPSIKFRDRILFEIIAKRMTENEIVAFLSTKAGAGFEFKISGGYVDGYNDIVEQLRECRRHVTGDQLKQYEKELDEQKHLLAKRLLSIADFATGKAEVYAKDAETDAFEWDFTLGVQSPATLDEKGREVEGEIAAERTIHVDTRDEKSVKKAISELKNDFFDACIRSSAACAIRMENFLGRKLKASAKLSYKSESFLKIAVRGMYNTVQSVRATFWDNIAKLSDFAAKKWSLKSEMAMLREYAKISDETVRALCRVNGMPRYTFLDYYGKIDPKKVHAEMLNLHAHQIGKMKQVLDEKFLVPIHNACRRHGVSFTIDFEYEEKKLARIELDNKGEIITPEGEKEVNKDQVLEVLASAFTAYTEEVMSKKNMRQMPDGGLKEDWGIGIKKNDPFVSALNIISDKSREMAKKRRGEVRE